LLLDARARGNDVLPIPDGGTDATRLLPLRPLIDKVVPDQDAAGGDHADLVLRLHHVGGDHLVRVEVRHLATDVLWRLRAREEVPALVALEAQPHRREADALGVHSAYVGGQDAHWTVVLAEAEVVEALARQRVDGALAENDQGLLEERQ